MRKSVGIICFCVISLLSACDSDNDGGNTGELTQQQNDDRVGRKVIRCGVEEVSQETIDAVLAGTQSSRTSSKPSRASGTVLIPVLFHVIAAGESESEGNVSDDQIFEQIRVLNFSYAGGQGGASTAFQFELQGISRTIDAGLAAMTIGSIAERQGKSALRQGGAGTLNIYSAIPTDGTLGWATFPWDYPTDPLLDGVVLQFETLPGGTLPPYNEGDTAVHEVGHWLGLFHTFQGSCSSQNDTIGDTPAEDGPAYGCPVGRDSCRLGDGGDSINNYMDYTDDSCLFEFTSEQAARIDQLSQTFRGL